MRNKAFLKIKRYTIYSCLSLQIGGKEIFFDTAKIRKSDLHELSPDLIFLSHESMDHMDPIQVYLLQKKKNCPIFCSIAAAVDLIQYFSYDIDFIDCITPLLPGTHVIEKSFQIYAAKSDHCDYMYPLVYKIEELMENVAIVHCFDSYLTEEIIELSRGTDLAIIPLGIAKGVSRQTGLECALRLHSRYFITNHFKNNEELEEFETLIMNHPIKERFFLVDWESQCDIALETGKKIKPFRDSALAELKEEKHLSIQQLKEYFTAIRKERSTLLKPSFLHHVLMTYEKCTKVEKVELLMIATFVSLLSPQLIPLDFVNALKEDFTSPPTAEVNGLKVSVYFFLGVYSQQVACTFFLDEAAKQLDASIDHVNYWMVEFLGRSATSCGGEEKKAKELLLRMIETPALYTSLVVRRKVFWELYRMMIHAPNTAPQFFHLFERGVVDENPDVRLLATLCFGLANRVYQLTNDQIEKVFALFDDNEDDVRETAIKVAGTLYNNHRRKIEGNIHHIQRLLSDKNCHVQFAAQETLQSIKR